MSGSNTSERSFDASGYRVAIVAARFNAVLVDQLIEGATRAWQAYGGSDASWSCNARPARSSCRWPRSIFAASGEYHAVIALGCVIRGDTPHFEYVAGECARGLMDAGLATGVPVIFGVLTTENQAQAEERAALTRMNKGARVDASRARDDRTAAPFSTKKMRRTARAAKRVSKKKGRR